MKLGMLKKLRLEKSRRLEKPWPEKMRLCHREEKVVLMKAVVYLM